MLLCICSISMYWFARQLGIHFAMLSMIMFMFFFPGFHLSGEVAPPSPPSPLPAGYTTLPMDDEKACKVSLSFDRCKITEVTCSCDQKDIFWCQHVVALALFRIRHPSKVQLRIPISGRYLKMSQPLIKHIRTNFLNFGAKSCQSRYLFWLVYYLIFWKLIKTNNMIGKIWRKNSNWGNSN